MAKKTEAQIEKENNFTYEQIVKKFIYDPETGCFYKRERVDVLDGWYGYRRLSIGTAGKRKFIKAHRAAFIYMTGKWPTFHIDHIDTDKGNNKWDNLREAEIYQNLSNMKKFKSNTSGFKGVHQRKCDGRFVAYIGHKKKKIHLGTFCTAELAYAAYCAKSDELHKEFSRKA